MGANVRKLAFDLGFRWLLPIQLLIALAVDYFYLRRPDLSGAFGAGIMLSVQATMTYNRIALWRTLPVTRQDIGQARWWQMIGLPGIGIVGMMAAAFILHILLSSMGWNHVPLRAGVMDIICDILVQFFYPVFLTLFSLAIAVARVTRSPLAYAATILVWAPWLLLFPHAVPMLTTQNRILILGLAGLAIATILGVTALRWPLPVAQPLQMTVGSARQATASSRAGQGGWIALFGMAVVRALTLVSVLVALYVAAILAFGLDHMLVMQWGLFAIISMLVQLSTFNSTALRVLRALPGSTFALAAYLFLLPLALVTAAVCFFSLALEPWLMNDIPLLDIVALSAALSTSALALPAALAARQTAMNLIIWFSMIPAGLIRLSWAYVPPPWHDERLLVGLALLAICGGFFWMHAQISRGTRVYRFQPFVPARWRGAD